MEKKIEQIVNFSYEKRNKIIVEKLTPIGSAFRSRGDYGRQASIKKLLNAALTVPRGKLESHHKSCFLASIYIYNIIYMPLKHHAIPQIVVSK